MGKSVVLHPDAECLGLLPCAGKSVVLHPDAECLGLLPCAGKSVVLHPDAECLGLLSVGKSWCSTLMLTAGLAAL